MKCLQVHEGKTSILTSIVSNYLVARNFWGEEIPRQDGTKPHMVVVLSLSK